MKIKLNLNSFKEIRANVIVVLLSFETGFSISAEAMIMGELANDFHKR